MHLLTILTLWDLVTVTEMKLGLSVKPLQASFIYLSGRCYKMSQFQNFIPLEILVEGVNQEEGMFRKLNLILEASKI